jgi:hypothetical protein
MAAVAECWPALSPVSHANHAARTQIGELLAAPESRSSAVASAAANLHLYVTGVFGATAHSAAAGTAAIAPADGAEDIDDSSDATLVARPFLNYAPHPLPPSPPRAHILLDCGISFNDAAARIVTPHMPLAMMHAIAKVPPRMLSCC